VKKLALSALVLVLCLSLAACTVDQVLSDIDLLLQTAAQIGTAVGAVSPADGAIITALSAIATKGITTLQKTYDSYKASGATTDLAKVRAAANALNSNLAAELAAAHISDPATLAKVTAWCTLIYTTTNLVLNALPQATASAEQPSGAMSMFGGSPKRAPIVIQIPTPEQLQAQWETQVCKSDQKCGKLVKARHVHGYGKVKRALTLGLAK
jgi:hypothetical protein